MKNNIQLVLEELEQELLEHEMNHCISQLDFEGAEVFKNAFFYTKRKIRALSTLDNPNYDKITYLQDRIKKLEELKDKMGYPKLLSESMGTMLSRYKTRLSKLKSAQRKFHYDNDAIITYLEKLISGELNSFKIDIFEEKKEIQIVKEKEMIRVVIKRKEGVVLDETIAADKSIALKKMGFLIGKKNATLDINIFSKTYVPLVVIEVLSRVVYDVFCVYDDRRAIIKL